MVDDRLRLQVFVASPSDTRPERGSLHAIIEELNLGVADSRGIVLELVEWETHSWPGVGLDPQDVINHQIDVPDIVIGIFWKRLGTETGRAASGSVEEIENALKLRAAGNAIEVLVYFNEETYFPRPEELDQVAGVFDFRRQLAGRGLLTASYEGLEDFKSKVRLHLTQIVRRWPIDGRPRMVPPPHVLRAVEEESADNRSSWQSEAAKGRLSVKIRSLLGGEAYAVVAAVTEAMREKGYESRARDRVGMTIMELLANANHAEAPAEVEVIIQPHWFKTVNISVASEGREFDIDQVVREGVRLLENGDREHGLLRVSRFSDSVSCSYDASSGTTRVECEICEPDRPYSVMDGVPHLASIVHDYALPRRLWIGGDSYTGVGYRLLGQDLPELGKIFFGALSEMNATWLGIEHVGSARMTVDDREPLLVEDAIKRYFKSAFDARRVLMLAHGVDPVIRSMARSWAARNDLEFFTSESEFASRIADLGSR